MRTREPPDLGEAILQGIGDRQLPGLGTGRQGGAGIAVAASAADIVRKVRGMQPWPVAFTHFPLPDGKPPIRLAVKKIRILEDSSRPFTAGQIVPAPTLVVATADRLVEIVRLQPAGKREMSGQDFLRGHRPAEGTRLVKNPE